MIVAVTLILAVSILGLIAWGIFARKVDTQVTYYRQQLLSTTKGTQAPFYQKE